MQDNPKFWQAFNNKDFVQAQQQLDELDADSKQAILEELFQKSQNQRMPDMVSVLYRELHEDKTFDDFRNAWHPDKQFCNETIVGGQTYQQYLPAPTRVINAINIKNPKEILSVGLTWVANEEQGKMMWEAATAQSKSNQHRADSINKVANKRSSDLFEPKSDDHLGVAF